MSRLSIKTLPVLIHVTLAGGGYTQQIQSTYADLALPGNWQAAKQFGATHFGSDIYYDPDTGALLQISQQAGMQRVGKIAKFFGAAQGPVGKGRTDVGGGISSLPIVYTEKAAKELGKGSKPPRVWELKEGEGNPLWFYASQIVR